MMSRGEIVAFQRTLETLRSNDADGNEKVKKKRFNKQNNNFALSIFDPSHQYFKQSASLSVPKTLP